MRFETGFEGTRQDNVVTLGNLERYTFSANHDATCCHKLRNLHIKHLNLDMSRTKQELPTRDINTQL